MQVRSAGYHVSFEGKHFSYLREFFGRASFSSIFILCDTNSKKNCLPFLLKDIKELRHAAVMTIRAGEEYKNLDAVNDCWEFLLRHNADRRSLVICLGGGVVCDLGGFAASTFKRGIAFIHVPTTLLAMADASVGGKTGVDYKKYKNLIGTITQPKGVFIHEHFLKTLPQQHIANGMAEVIKAALIGDARLWKKILAAQKIKDLDVSQCIRASVNVKNKIVVRDPNEENVRQTLNFGHTVGHAVESYFLGKKNSLLHGEAIAIGMCVELCLGKLIGRTYAETAMSAIMFLKNNYVLPRFSKQQIETFVLLMKQDKKNTGGHFNFALIEKPGTAWINMKADVSQVRQAFQLYNNILSK